MPATAAIDNETLDHLLSVVNDRPNVRAIPRMSKRRIWRETAVISADFAVGNFAAAGDVIDSERAPEHHMRYFFRLTDGANELNPHQGIELLGNAAAREEALRFAREVKAGEVLPGRNWDGWFVRIVDEHGKEIDTVPLDAVPDGPEVPAP